MNAAGRPRNQVVIEGGISSPQTPHALGSEVKRSYARGSRHLQQVAFRRSSATRQSRVPEPRELEGMR